jgi:trans-aconitate methyltransferase
VDKPELQKGEFNKAFSNAAMHWILSNTAKHEQFFHGVKNALQPGGVFVFEMGGLGNVTELVTGIMSGVSRRIGLEAAKKSNPWFFPDEEWARDILENRVGGWKIEKIEREWRETPADAGGVDGWIRLMARPFLDAVPEAEREACTREIIEILEYTTRTPKGSYALQYVRLRVQARKL